MSVRIRHGLTPTVDDIAHVSPLPDTAGAFCCPSWEDIQAGHARGRIRR